MLHGWGISCNKLNVVNLGGVSDEIYRESKWCQDRQVKFDKSFGFQVR